MFNPDAIYYEPDIENYALGKELLIKYQNIPKFEIENHNNIPEMRTQQNSEFPKMNQDNTFQNTNSFLINNNDTLYHSPSSNSLKNISSKNLISTIPEMDNKNNKNKEIDQKHIMNKISARKSRQKKKEYIKNLEEEILKLKNELN